MARNHNNYGGKVSAPFTVVGSFEIRRTETTDQVRLVFDTWISVANFDADGDAINRLQRTVEADTAFTEPNIALLGQVQQALFADAGIAGRGFVMERFNYFPVEKVMSFRAVHPTNGEEEFRSKRSASFNAFVTANQTVFNNLNTKIWEYAQANDLFLAAMTTAT